MVHKTKGKAEKNGGQSCKQGEKCDVSGLSVMVKDQLPDVSFISAENLVHNTGIVGGVGGQFNAELLSGIFMGGGAENEPSKNGEHQKIENVSWSLAGRGFLLGHGNSPCM